MSWSDERVDTLRTLWTEGFSASEIAARLGSVTRNAVIGKVHRLGLQGRVTRSRLTRQPPRAMPPRFTGRSARLPAIGRPPLPCFHGGEGATIQADDELVIPLDERRSILTLTANSCRWPIGDPKQDGFHFCGRSRLPDRPYCDVHLRRAFRTPHPRSATRDLPPSVALPGPSVCHPRNPAA
jgi:GcrA cell cycle regulator